MNELTAEELAKVAVSSEWTEVARALAELYEAYYEISTPADQCRMDVEVALSRLMAAYNTWLG